MTRRRNTLLQIFAAPAAVALASAAGLAAGLLGDGWWDAAAAAGLAAPVLAIALTRGR